TKQANRNIIRRLEIRKRRETRLDKFISKGIVRGARFMDFGTRFNYYKVAPKALDRVWELELYTRSAELDKKLKELIKVRVSQINGCSFCLDMHTKAAKKLKATDEELQQLETWRESDLFSSKEKMAFELAEKVTLISEHGVSDELYNRVREHYDEKEYVDLIMVINQINLWNRLAISMGHSVK